jgi:hypothetical protein
MHSITFLKKGTHLLEGDVKFNFVTDIECTFSYKKHKFLLQEKRQGVYSGGKAVLLYEVKGFDKNYIKTIGWTMSDGGYDTYKKGEAYYKEIVDFNQCKIGAVEYICKFLK